MAASPLVITPRRLATLAFHSTVFFPQDRRNRDRAATTRRFVTASTTQSRAEAVTISFPVVSRLPFSRRTSRGCSRPNGYDPRYDQVNPFDTHDPTKTTSKDLASKQKLLSTDLTLCMYL